MEQRYVIKRKDRPGQMLKGLGIGTCNPLYPDQWTKHPAIAIQFNKEEAQATIDFINNVLDEYLGEQLYYEPIEA